MAEPVEDGEATAGKGVTVADPPLVTQAPQGKRSIVENASLSALIENNTICRKCKLVGKTELRFPAVGLATIPTLCCGHCDGSQKGDVQPTGLEKAKKGSVKLADFAVNVLCVLSFLASGDGGTEAQKVMAMLGLPHIQSMEKDVFSKVE